MLKTMQSQENKNIFQNTITFFLFLFILISNSYASDNKLDDESKIRYGYPNQSIFVATVNGKEQPTTPMLSVAEELFKRANISWSANAYPAKRLFKNLKNGKTNFTILVRASSLLDDFIFSKKPVYSTDLNVYYIGNKPSIDTKEDLIGKKVVTIRGYSYGKLLKFIDDPKNNITKEVSNTHSGAFRMLELGRADYLIDYASATEDIISENKVSNLRLSSLKQLDIFLVLSKSYPNADKFMKKLETIIESMDIKEIVRRSAEKPISN